MSEKSQMKPCMIGLALLLVAGNSWARAPSPGMFNVPGAVSTFLVGNSQFPLGVAGGTQSFLAGHITDGFDHNTNGFNGLFTVLTEGTRLSFTGTVAQHLDNKIFDILLPTYKALDGPATRLAGLGTPILEPLGKDIVKFSTVFADALDGSGRQALPGLK